MHRVASEAGAPKEKVDEFTGEPTGDLERPAEDYQVSKAQGNTRLRSRYYIENIKELKNAKRLGRPTDQYQDLSPQEATVLGDMAKELYLSKLTLI